MVRARALLRLLAAVPIVIVGLYLVISVCVLVFILTGQLTVGSPMYIDMTTPTYGQLLIFQVVSVAVIVFFVFIRRALKP